MLLVDSLPCMKHTRLAATTLLLAAALTGCSDDPEPAAAPTSSAPATSAAPSPSTDDKRGCRAVVAIDNAETDPTVYRDAGALAAEASVPGIKQAGIDLVNAANAASAEPGVEANLALDRAALAVAQACADEFGDGPWN